MVGLFVREDKRDILKGMQSPTTRFVRAVLFVALLCACPWLFSQASLAPPDKKYADEPSVIQSFSSIVAVNADGTGTRLQTVSVKILYREGKYAEALGYIKAALRSVDQPEVRDHLSAVATALHNPSASALARQTDQQLRTLPLGPAKGRHGTGEWRMLIVDGKVLSLGPPATNAYTAPIETETKPQQALPGAEVMVKSADMHALLPPGSNARLVRDGFVTCPRHCVRTCTLAARSWTPLKVSESPQQKRTDRKDITTVRVRPSTRLTGVGAAWLVSLLWFWRRRLG
jgi:hypothetical protein